MKNMFFLTIVVAILHACGNKVDKLPPTFSTADIRIAVAGCDTTIISQSDEWTFGDCLLLDNQTTNYPQCEEVFSNSEPPAKTPGICSDKVLTVKYDFLSEKFEPVQITGSWFKLTKKSLQEANIVVSPNLSGKPRTLKITVDRGGTTIAVSQSGY
ncbi:MAG: hypothetical protein LBG47_04910 [Prevotellaceae bacterium]|jgi:hypothetical protein|nr:hypothetical protein [Prevotellaceae bacterium]